MTPLIEIDQMTYSHPQIHQPIFKKFSMTFTSGECHVLLGRSGCGKSTLLRLVAGLLQPQSGTIATYHSGQQFLFQDYDSFPWLTVFDNVKIGSGPPSYPSDGDVIRILERVGLSHVKDKYPKDLSGGMRKRLGFARTLIRKPQLLLLDEPFASLDIALRIEMYGLLQELILEHKTTVLLVSHDLHETLILGDQIYVLGECPATVIQQIANPFKHPRTEDIVHSEFYANTHQSIADRLKGLA